MTRVKRAAGALAGAAGWMAARLPGVTGAALISYGTWLVYAPAGLVVAGVFCLLADWRSAR